MTQDQKTENEQEEITGGCFCGAIRYRFTSGAYPVADCHCTLCRRTSGAPYVSWVVVPGTAFSYTRGEPAVLRSSDAGTRYYCRDCGTPLGCVSTRHPDIVDITLGSLDTPEAFPPTLTVFEDTRLPWLPDGTHTDPT